jgi:hypothetical protein
MSYATSELVQAEPQTPVRRSEPFPHSVEEGVAAAVYDEKTMTIHIEVAVYLNSTGSDIDILAAPVLLPADEWTLFWNLRVEGEGIEASFADPGGIVFAPEIPPRVTVVEEPHAVSGTEWTAKVLNQVVGVNLFHYTIAVEWSPIGANGPQRVTKKDPTIAVTSDPIG